MKTQSQKESQNVYLEHGYNYIVVFVESTSNSAFYETQHFTNKKQAERYNEEKLQGFGEVLTVRQSVKKYDFLTL